MSRNLPNFTASDYVPNFGTAEPEGNEEVRLILTGDTKKASEIRELSLKGYVRL